MNVPGLLDALQTTDLLSRGSLCADDTVCQCQRRTITQSTLTSLNRRLHLTHTNAHNSLLASFQGGYREKNPVKDGKHGACSAPKGAATLARSLPSFLWASVRRPAMSYMKASSLKSTLHRRGLEPTSLLAIYSYMRHSSRAVRVWPQIPRLQSFLQLCQCGATYAE